MAAIITNDFRIFQAKAFRETFDPVSGNSVYCGIGKSTAWSDENVPDTPVDTYSANRNDFRDLLSIKKIGLNDTQFLIPRLGKNWVYGTTYAMYDHLDGTLYEKDFYVINSEGNVYKCIFNGTNPVDTAGIPSTVEPTGTSVNQFKTVDGYVWQFMYTVHPQDSANFLTNNWIPCRQVEVESDNATQWAVQEAAADRVGGVCAIVVTNGGSGYSSTPTITVNDSTGFGSGAVASAVVEAGVIKYIYLTNVGTNYIVPTITITDGTGNSATARAIVSPDGGHGSNAVRELGAWYVGTCIKLEYNDGGDFTVKNDYRKIMLITNPTIGGIVATGSTYSATVRLNVSGVVGTFVSDEEVFVKLAGDTVFRGRVLENNGTNLVLSTIFGNPFDAVDNVLGDDSGATATVSSVVLPEIDFQSGQLIYKDYRRAINRSTDQIEQILTIIEF